MVAGGPAWRPTGLADGTGAGGEGGGAGGPWQPTQGQCTTYYPGPSHTQWDSWCPPTGAGKGGVANWFGGGGQTLTSAQQTVPGWLLHPGGRVASFIHKDKVAAKDPKQFEDSNKFEALDDEDDDHGSLADLMPPVRPSTGVPAPPATITSPAGHDYDTTILGLDRPFTQAETDELYEEVRADVHRAMEVGVDEAPAGTFTLLY